MKRFCKEVSLSFKNPEVAQEWDLEKNYPLIPDVVYASSNKKAWWTCKNGHKYESRINSRINGNGCPYCSGIKACQDNCLLTVKPVLASEWHPTKNGSLTAKDVVPGSHKCVWWMCKNGHQYSSTIKNRSKGGCPYCSGRRVCRENCLSAVSPDIAKEWNYDKNGDLTPDCVVAGSNKLVWWTCSLGHVYEEKVNNRKRCGCPYCSSHRVCEENSLFVINPKLSLEWNYSRNNGMSPRDVSSCSGKMAWWRCANGHEWKAKISNRSNGRGCPYCCKIELKDGCLCDSLSEAYFYLKLKSEHIAFDHHIPIDLGKCVVDFYIPLYNKYIEVTGYSDQWKYWSVYYRNIQKKESYITSTLNANFEFIKLSLTKEQIKYVRENSK